MNGKLIIMIFTLSLLGCTETMPLRNSVSTNDAFTPNQANGRNNLTLGLVQQVVKVGVLKEDVVTKLGSPNMVTTSSDGAEVWIYDAVSTISLNHTSASGISAGIGIGSRNAGALVGANNYSKTNETSINSRSLTVVIKFGKNNRVLSFNTRASQF